jgi:hypothetical protein
MVPMNGLQSKRIGICSRLSLFVIGFSMIPNWGGHVTNWPLVCDRFW